MTLDIHKLGRGVATHLTRLTDETWTAAIPERPRFATTGRDFIQRYRQTRSDLLSPDGTLITIKLDVDEHGVRVAALARLGAGEHEELLDYRDLDLPETFYVTASLHSAEALAELIRSALLEGPRGYRAALAAARANRARAAARVEVLNKLSALLEAECDITPVLDSAFRRRYLGNDIELTLTSDAQSLDPSTGEPRDCVQLILTVADPDAGPFASWGGSVLRLADEALGVPVN